MDVRPDEALYGCPKCGHLVASSANCARVVQQGDPKCTGSVKKVRNAEVIPVAKRKD